MSQRGEESARPSAAVYWCRAQYAVLALVFTVAIAVAITRLAALLSA